MSTHEERVFVLRGQPGASLFSRPFGTSIHLPEQWSDLSDLVKKAFASGDDRSYAIITALVMENRLERLLYVWLPRFKKLSEKREFTTSLKIELLRAANLIPRHILECADCVRVVRNDFAHDLSHDSFEQMKQNSRTKVEQLYLRIFGQGKPAGEPIKVKFSAIGFVAMRGLHEYARNVSLLHKKTRHTNFENALESANDVGPDPKDPMQLTARSVGDSEPEVEISNGFLVEHYEDSPGMLVITPLNHRGREEG